MTATQRWTLGAVCTATFMLLLDITIVNVALPDIAASLHSSFEDLQWVVDAYSLSLAALMLTAGSISDILGRRAVFVGGLVVFTVASLLCGLAGTPLVLDLARALQGVGGAAMFATSLALLAAAFSGPQRGTALGIWGATIGGAVAVGPLVGGLLTEHISWESIFYINVPIGILAVAATLMKVEESTGTPGTRIDVAGLVTFSSGLFFLVFALVRGNAEGWGSGLIVGFLAAAAVLLVLFVVVEARSDRPMLQLDLFRKPAFAGASIAAFCLSAGMFAMFLYITLYIQNTLGYQPLSAGVKFLPLTVLSFCAAAVAGPLTGRIQVRWLMGGGLALVGLGLFLMRAVDPGSDWTALLPGFLISGCGIGMTNPSLASTAVGVVEPQRAGMGSGINNTFRQVGIATGIAGLGALFQHLLETKIPGGPPGEVLAAGDPAVLGPHGHAAFVAGYTSALDTLFLVAALISWAGALLALVLVRQGDFAAHHQSAPAAAPA